MDFLESVVLAIVQGLTEWLPISSEGVSSMLMVNFFGRSLAEAVFLSLWLHMGTLLAAVVYFWSDIRGILHNLPNYIRSPRGMEGYKGLTNFLLVSTVTTALVGIPVILFSVDKIDFYGGHAMAFIGALLIITGLLQRFARQSGIVSDNVRISDAVIVGAVQGLAVLPGLSRSGLTTSALLLRKHEAGYALKLSFLMSIPAVLMAEVGLVLMQKITFDVFSLVAVLVSFLLGLLTLGSLLRVAEKVNFGYFCIFLGAIGLLAAFV